MVILPPYLPDESLALGKEECRMPLNKGGKGFLPIAVWFLLLPATTESEGLGGTDKLGCLRKVLPG